MILSDDAVDAATASAINGAPMFCRDCQERLTLTGEFLLIEGSKDRRCYQCSFAAASRWRRGDYNARRAQLGRIVDLKASPVQNDHNQESAQ